MPHSCDICLEKYDSHTKVPKNLECGHHLCHPCLVGLLRGSKSCPLCRVALSKEHVDDYQTVFQLIDAQHMCAKDKESIEDLEDLKMQLRKTKESYKKALKSNEREMRRLQQSKAKLEETRKFLQKELKATNQNLKRIEEMAHGGAGPTQKTGHVEGLPENLSLDISEDHYFPYYFMLKEFASSEDYLREVRKRAERGEPIFACHRRLDGLSYGKVSYEGGANYLHPEKFNKNFPNGLVKVCSMTHSCVEDEAVFTPFEDLKGVAKGHSIAFVDTRGGGSSPWNWIIPLNESPLARQFLILCTGEEGPTYRNSQILRNNDIFSVNDYQLNGASTSGRLPSTTSLPSRKFDNLSYTLLEGFPDGSFKAKLDRDYRNFSSKIVMSHEFYGYQSRSVASSTGAVLTISECGFALKC